MSENEPPLAEPEKPAPETEQKPPETEQESTETEQKPHETEQESTETEQKAQEAENKGSEAAQKGEKKVNPAVLGGAALVLAVALFALLGGRHRVVSYDKPIPYIFNKHFLAELREFADQQFHKEILVFHGAQGVGKTRGLRQFIEQLKEEDRVVFNFDFKMIGKFATVRDLVDYLESVVVQGIQDLETQQVRVSDLKNSLALVEALSTVEGKLAKGVAVPIKDATLQRVARALVTVLERIADAPEVSVRGFLEGIDALAPLRPLLIVNDIENLGHCETEEIREFGRVLWRVCETFANDYRILGVIVEISDESTLVHSFRNARLRTVEEFNPDDARSILLKGDFFTKKNLQFIKDKFGGNGQKYATMHDLLREGLTVNAAFEQIEKQTTDKVMMAAGVGKDRDARLDYLRLLRTRRVLPIAQDVRTAAHLLSARVITLANATHCRFPSVFVENTVETVLKQYRK